MGVMPGAERAIEQLLRKQAKLKRKEQDRDEAMRERDDALRAARAAGATNAEIIAATGMSSPTVTKALRRA